MEHKIKIIQFFSHLIKIILLHFSQKKKKPEVGKGTGWGLLDQLISITKDSQGPRLLSKVFGLKNLHLQPAADSHNILDLGGNIWKQGSSGLFPKEADSLLWQRKREKGRDTLVATLHC